MASIVKRGKRYCVVYTYVTSSGDRKQKWESFKNKAEAEKRRSEVEYSKSRGSFVVPKCTTLEELAREYVDLYGKSKWSMSTYGRNVALFENYILPVLGKMDLADITPRVIEKYYKSLLEMDAVPPKVNGRVIKVKEQKKVSPSVIRDAHKLLASCFRQAVKWELMAKNPCENATRPKVEKTERNIWTMEDLQHALDVCEDDRLKVAINLAFSCTLRIGEMLGLTWDCVDISEKAMNTGMPYIHINKELQRVDRAVLKELGGKDVIFEFPAAREKSKTVMVLKTPKTRTSVRKVYLPHSAAKLLIEWKEKQDLQKEALGSEYTDYDLVFAGAFGGPIEEGTINDELQRLIREYDLPKVVFHSLRHSSITYKLKLNGGDIKAVQGDSGHAQAMMVTEQYSHVLSEGQKMNAELIEKYFYGKAPIPERQGIQNAGSGGVDANSLALLAKLLTNPDTAELLKNLAASLKQ